MSKHFKVVLDDFQCFLKLQCPKAKMLKKCVKESKKNIQLGKREGHVRIRAHSQDCEI
jgi:hypothetical protein